MMLDLCLKNMTQARNLARGIDQWLQSSSTFAAELMGSKKWQGSKNADFLVVAWIDGVNWMLTSPGLIGKVSRILSVT